jgi:hypothetical protein
VTLLQHAARRAAQGTGEAHGARLPGRRDQRGPARGAREEPRGRRARLCALLRPDTRGGPRVRNRVPARRRRGRQLQGVRHRSRGGLGPRPSPASGPERIPGRARRRDPLGLFEPGLPRAPREREAPGGSPQAAPAFARVTGARRDSAVPRAATSRDAAVTRAATASAPSSAIAARGEIATESDLHALA